MVWVLVSFVSQSGPNHPEFSIQDTDKMALACLRSAYRPKTLTLFTEIFPAISHNGIIEEIRRIEDALKMH
ncbi:MAG: hypothetical protein ACFE0J_01095 [Elainellaceae cyanobacterium]